MILNYIKIGWRHLKRGKGYSLISIIGLAIGICCSLFISLYVQDELSYDQFHEKKDRIFRIVESIEYSGEIHAALTSFPVGPTYVADYPEVISYVRFLSMGNKLTIKIEDQIFREDKFWLADSTLFDIMSFKLLHGDVKEALKAPRSLVLSRTLATKFFDSPEAAMGQNVQVGSGIYNVTGVVEDSPGNTDIDYNAFGSMSSLPEQQQEVLNGDWFRLSCYTYLLFQQPTSNAEFQPKMDDFRERYIVPFVATFGSEGSAEFTLQPLPELHFDNSREYDTPKGNLSYISIFILLAVFILVIASINFVNLSLSQSVKRAKEVGVRKTLGATPGQVRNQFLGESILIVCIALIIGLALVEVFLTPFNQITGKEFGVTEVFQPIMVLTMFLIVIITGLVSGIYPAVVLSGFEASRILRGNLPKIGRFGNLRRVLMVVQFAFSLFMIIGTISIFQQMKYLQNKELGFDQDQIVILTIPQDTAVFNKLAYFKEDLLSNPKVLGVTGSGGIPGSRVGELMFRIEQEGQMMDKSIKMMAADEDFFDLLGIDVIDGRNFSEEIQSDVQQGFIINETAVRKFNWTDDAIGKRMQWGLEGEGRAAYDGKVVGVVEDFHFASLHNVMEPLAVLFRPNYSRLFSVKLAGGDVEGSISFLEDKWVEFAGNHPFEYQFLDERIQTQYESEKTLLTIFGYFAMLSILIAGLGLFALTSFTVEQRLKEFSVRKVLGAGIPELGRLLGKEFVVLLVVALVLISPLAYYLISEWLENFSYRIDIPLYSFLLAAVVSLAITLGTISYHIWVLSRTNPARILRME